MRWACLAASWLTLAVALVFIGLSFTTDVHVTVGISMLCAGLPTLGCWVWAYELPDSPMRRRSKDSAEMLRPGEPATASPPRRALSSWQRRVALAFAIVIGVSFETAIVGLAHGKSVEDNGRFFRCSLKGCHGRVPITEAEFWRLQTYGVRLFCSWFTVFAGLPILAFTAQKEERPSGHGS